jgi:hypothetical protein
MAETPDFGRVRRRRGAAPDGKINDQPAEFSDKLYP